MIGSTGVRRSLPHRYPMLLVDSVREVVPGKRLVAIKAVTLNEPWYSRLPHDTADEDLAYPPVLLLESWGQAAGLLAGAENPGPGSQEGSVMLFGGASRVEYRRPVLPGEVLEHHIRLGRRFEDAVTVEGETRSGAETVLTVGQGLMAFRPASALRPDTN
ncbi:3-hydroxyacyl-ACP dehydratase FabZ family protein [Streptomyces gobiensis]|uniref:3-hydroxyacyl-ACP dehydratase FabZ family protein n=1 Tax=Streptomyces gobiensis TaxID=2875706 RepID=UPI001E3E897B|nr:3-hydroxyacyl-ACP dehydratase FabZ family protein [Streptomyces gobiensis]UGY94198.1 beta-hydroxyacyl-ACP dehydratase [Streptomyces gobiensis]